MLFVNSVDIAVFVPLLQYVFLIILYQVIKICKKKMRTEVDYKLKKIRHVDAQTVLNIFLSIMHVYDMIQ